jgi:hypothetical protein
MKTIYDAGDLSQYDDTEVSLVAEFTLPDGTRACESLSTLDMADVDATDYPDAVFFYSVYLHVKTGGTVCAGDFSLLDDAQIYCHALDALLAI